MRRRGHCRSSLRSKADFGRNLDSEHQNDCTEEYGITGRPDYVGNNKQTQENDKVDSK